MTVRSSSLPWIFLVASFFFAASLEARGGTSTHGADLIADSENIWFLHAHSAPVDGPVEYCLITDAALLPQPDVPTLRAEVRAAFDAWIRFFRHYHLAEKTFRPPFKDGALRKMELEFREVATCDPARKDQIAFAFGTRRHPLLEKNEEQMRTSLGVAIPWPFDHNRYRTGGVVWIGPGLNILKTRTMLLHELGHVFGMPHDSVSVMDALIAERIKESWNPVDGTIESPSWKYRFEPGDVIDFMPRQLVKGCPRPGLLPNIALDAVLRRRFEMKDDGCHALRLRFLDRYFNGTESMWIGKNYWNHMRLEISHIERDGQEKLFALEGYLGWIPIYMRHEPLPGPGLFTEWGKPLNKVSPERNWRFYLDEFQPVMPGRGYFNDREYLNVPVPGGTVQHLHERKVGAELVIERGPVLRIFFPEVSGWWEISDAFYVTEHFKFSLPYFLYGRDADESSLWELWNFLTSGMVKPWPASPSGPPRT